ncbi:MAG: ATPase, T2SS/T4P/T4SS family [Armatimonadota bacterium]
MGQEESKETKPAAKLLSAADVAHQLGITKAAVERLREEGKLPGVRGRWGRWFYHPDSLAAVIMDAPAVEPTTLSSIISEIAPPKYDDDDVEDNKPASEQAPMIRMANAILVQAIDSRASDIHIESHSRYIFVRCRIDGVLHEIMKIPNHIKGPLIQRYKVMADMNILERRVPQAGRIPIKYAGADYDFRVSTLPSSYGENVIIHILKQTESRKGLNHLGFGPPTQARLDSFLTEDPAGLLLVTGPGGSGITTTAYNMLWRINSFERKILALESLPEYNLDGVIHSYYGGHRLSTLSETLRLLPLMDVDTVFLGDVNTTESLSGAAETALRGKQVIATMAAEDACMALWRLSQLTMFAEKKVGREEAYSLLPRYQTRVDKAGQPLLQTVLGILSQRLLRKVCPECKEPYSAPPASLSSFGLPTDDLNAEVTLFRGKGCEACRNSGYHGRIAVYELLSMNPEIAALAALQAPLGDIREAAQASGMRDMRTEALTKVLEGITTPEEVLRVLGRPKNIGQ